MSAIATEIIDRIDALDGARARWVELEKASAAPTQHFVWSRACAETLGGGDDLRFTVVRDGGRWAAVAPLVRAKGLAARFEAVGVEELNEPTDFLYADASALETLTDDLARRGAALRLSRVPADSPSIAALEEAYRGRGFVYVTEAGPCPYIDLDASWTEPERHFNSGRRSDLRRAQRHAGELGAVTIEVISPEASRVSPLLEEAFRVEAKSWKGDSGSALLADPKRAAFFREYATSAAAEGILRLAFLRVGGEAIAMQIALESNQRFWLLKIGYDAARSRCSPGTLLMLHTVRHAAERGLLSYEFLGEVAPWTATWTKDERPCVSVRTYPASVSGAAALARDGATWALARAERRWRARADAAVA